MIENYFFDGKTILKFDHDLPILLSVLKSIAAYLGGIIVFTLYAAFVSGVQSVFFSILMEYVIKSSGIFQKVNARKW